jgi:hypothetical protein
MSRHQALGPSIVRFHLRQRGSPFLGRRELKVFPELEQVWHTVQVEYLLSRWPEKGSIWASRFRFPSFQLILCCCVSYHFFHSRCQYPLYLSSPPQSPSSRSFALPRLTVVCIGTFTSSTKHLFVRIQSVSKCIKASVLIHIMLLY